MALQVLTSVEGYQDLVSALYQKYLRRPVDSAGQAAFTAALLNGATDQQIIADLVGSQEYFNRL